MFGKKETDAEKEAKKLANKLADETPADEQVDLYREPGINVFGQIPERSAANGGAFVERRDKSEKA